MVKQNVEKKNGTKVSFLSVLGVLCIMDVWNGNESHVLVAKVGPYKLFYKDFFQLGPGQELESEVQIP